MNGRKFVPWMAPLFAREKMTLRIVLDYFLLLIYYRAPRHFLKTQLSHCMNLFFQYLKLYTRIPVLLAVLVLSSCSGGDTSQKNKRTISDTSAVSQANTDLTAEDLRNASLKGRMPVVRRAIQQGVKIDAGDESGQTPLMLASFGGNADIVRLLLDNGAQVNTSNAEGRTPLHFAASGPFPDTVELLLKNNADPDAIDQVEGWTPLMFAAAEGHQKVVQTLIDHNADTSLRDKDGETARDFAANNNHREVVALFDSLQADQ
jgi:uncharacterized protein